MSNWPQYVVIAGIILRFILQVARDMDKPTPREMWYGAVTSVIANAVPIWLLHEGGFFDRM